MLDFLDTLLLSIKITKRTHQNFFAIHFNASSGLYLLQKFLFSHHFRIHFSRFDFLVIGVATLALIIQTSYESCK